MVYQHYGLIVDRKQVFIVYKKIFSDLTGFVSMWIQ